MDGGVACAGAGPGACGFGAEPLGLDPPFGFPPEPCVGAGVAGVTTSSAGGAGVAAWPDSPPAAGGFRGADDAALRWRPEAWGPEVRAGCGRAATAAAPTA